MLGQALTVSSLVAALLPAAAPPSRVPSIDRMLGLEWPGTAHISPDERVPIANAYALYRGLKDRGVPVKLIVYRGHGHGIYKPREQRALMEQNFQWFSEHLWGDKPGR